MLVVCHSYAICMMNSYVTRKSFVCHSYVVVCHLYVLVLRGRIGWWLAAWAWKPKVPCSSLAAGYVQI